MLAHLIEPAVKSCNQLVFAGVHRLQAMRRLGRVASVILRRMPFACGHFGEEAFHLRWIGKQLAIEMPGIPIDQDSAEVEYGNGGA